jgi:hypothetical protein
MLGHISWAIRMGVLARIQEELLRGLVYLTQTLMDNFRATRTRELGGFMELLAQQLLNKESLYGIGLVK